MNRSGPSDDRIDPVGTDVLKRIRSTVAPMAKTALLRTGACAAVRTMAPSRSIAILRYHAICNDDGYAYADPYICISPAAFERHVAYLAAHYNVMRLEDVAAWLRAGTPLPRNAVSITFDDGYADNLEAARTLNRHGVSATFFITADCLAGGLPFWPSEIRTLIPAVKDSVLRLDVAGQAVDIPVGSDQERRSAIRRVTKLFKSNTIPVRDAMREQMRKAAGYPALPDCMLRWDQLAEMHRLGMTVGAHTLTHPNLPSAGLPAAQAEITGSKARLERELGIQVTQFSYPNGGADTYYTPDLQRIVADAGYTAASSSRNAFAGATSDLYALERVEVEERLEDLVFALEVERFAFKPRPSRIP
jgi:peptidoglycan/xylan/chitin deacetylase (PgdA/CDA1 family)